MSTGAMPALGRFIGSGILSRFAFGSAAPAPITSETYPLLPDADGKAFHLTRRQLLDHLVVRGPTGPDRSRVLLDVATSVMAHGAGIVQVANGPNEPAINALLRLAEAMDVISRVDVIAFDGSTGRPSVLHLRKSIEADRIVTVWLPGPAYSRADNLRAAHAFIGMLEAAFEPSSRRSVGMADAGTAPTLLLLDDPTPYAETLSAGLAARMRSSGIGMVYGIESDERFAEIDPAGAAGALESAANRIDLGGPAGPEATYAGAPLLRTSCGAARPSTSGR